MLNNEQQGSCQIDTQYNNALSQQFYREVLSGLCSQPKALPSKYFYDAAGDVLFQQIMHSNDYYLTRSELEIFTGKLREMTTALRTGEEPFDLIELGPGDSYKSIHLLKELIRQDVSFTYVPIDISGAILDFLSAKLSMILPDMNINALNGEFLPMLARAVEQSDRRKVILCLGGNIGNMTVKESYEFCQEVRSHLRPGDIMMLGFDLIKNPHVIRTAYSDSQGITRMFNLNLLKRINQELDANFNLGNFDHYCSYEPETGSCKSFLISLEEQTVRIGETEISFKRDEYIWTEISQKYSAQQIGEMATATGFDIVTNLFDSKRWFVDTVWQAI